MFQEGVWCFALHKEKHSSNRLQPDSWMNFLKRKWRKDKYRVWLCASDQGIRTLNTFDTQLETASVANLLIWSNDFKNTSDWMFVCSDLKKKKQANKKKCFWKEIPTSFTSSDCIGELCPFFLHLRRQINCKRWVFIFQSACEDVANAERLARRPAGANSHTWNINTGSSGCDLSQRGRSKFK